MHWVDWLIVTLPLLVVGVVCFKTQKHVRAVADFLVGGRVAGRYLLTVATGAAEVGLISAVGFYEVFYASGYAFSFWAGITGVVTLFVTLTGFDATGKSRAELNMLSELGVRMVNTFLTGHDGAHEFVDYSSLGHPEMVGFPSANSDNGWVRGRKYGDPAEYIVSQIKKNGAEGKHMAIMFHDDTEWIDVNDKELDLMKLIADVARDNGYELSTHLECYKRFKLR